MGRQEGAPPRRLDGSRLATDRAEGLARRAARVLASRGRPPRLVILARTEAGQAPPPHVALKQRAAADLGVEIHARLLTPDAGTDAWIDTVAREAANPDVDGVFVQYPLSDDVDTQAVYDAIPVALDVDVLSAAALDRFAAGQGPPPATVAAAFEILEAYAVDLEGRGVQILGGGGALGDSFRLMFERRGARVGPRAGGDVVVTLGGQPGAFSAADLPDGAVVIDGGYFNAGAAGDVDLAGGAGHLGALIPVPGGLGPMTISVLLERTIAHAEG